MRALVPAFLEQTADEIVAAGPRVVGFRTTFSQNVPSLVLARMLKNRYPSLRIVFGGANCDGPMGAALHRVFPWIDVVVRGEAERILPELVRDLLAGGAIRPRPGLCYRDGERSVAVAQAAAARSRWTRSRRRSSTSTSSGSPRPASPPRSCARCDCPTRRRAAAGGVRSRTARSAASTAPPWPSAARAPTGSIEELTALARRITERVDFTVDNILDMQYFQRRPAPAAGQRPRPELFYETKANLTPRAGAAPARLRRRAFQPGIESLSTPILQLMRKGVTALQNVRLLKWCAEYGIRVWNVIYGFPGEPPEEYARLAGLAPSLTHLVPPLLCRLALHRFSPYHERPAEFGLEVSGPLPWYRLVYPVDDATLADLAYTFDYRHAGRPGPRGLRGAPCARRSRPGRRRMPRGAIAPFAIVAVPASSSSRTAGPTSSPPTIPSASARRDSCWPARMARRRPRLTRAWTRRTGRTSTWTTGGVPRRPGGFAPHVRGGRPLPRAAAASAPAGARLIRASSTTWEEDHDDRKAGERAKEAHARQADVEGSSAVSAAGQRLEGREVGTGVQIR